jgi:hypothetical protein
MSRLRILLLAATLAPGLAPASAEREWRFRVLLDGSEVGTHSFRVAERDGERRVASDARFAIKLLFINAYTYVHEARERWQGDCLAELDSRTDDNGRRIAVRGASDGERFQVEGAGARARLPGCVMSFAYWNPAMLTQPRLLNVQTGELTDVRIEPLGEETLRVRGAPTSARRYALHAPKFRIDLWYADGASWVQLESRTEGGRMLRYEIQ